MVDRRFWTGYGRQADFELVFSKDGPWPRLLAQSDGYLGTEIWCEISELRQYRVRDFWSWHRKFEVFRSTFQEQLGHCEHLLRLEQVVEREQFLGAYYEKEYGDATRTMPNGLFMGAAVNHGRWGFDARYAIPAGEWVIVMPAIGYGRASTDLVRMTPAI